MDKSLTPIFLFAALMLGTARVAPRWALRRPVLVGVLTAALVVWGIATMRSLPIELIPNAASDAVTVTVGVRGGMSPADVEALIVRPLEDSLGDSPRLKNMVSSAKKDRGVVTLEFHTGADMKRAAAEINERVDRTLGRLPPEIEKPVIAHFEESDAPVYIAAVWSDRFPPEIVRRAVDDHIKDALLRSPGVANVEIGGGRESKILIELDRDKLAAYGLSATGVTRFLSRRNVAVQVGRLEGRARATSVQVSGRLKKLDDFRKVIVARDRSGGVVLLENVATVRDGYLEPESLSRLNGRAAVSIYVQKESSANTLRVVKGIERSLDQSWRSLPARYRNNLHRATVSNQAVGILAALTSVRCSLASGVLLILLSLCIAESERKSTKRMAWSVLGFLFMVMLITAFRKTGEAPVEPLYWALLCLFVTLAFFDPDLRPGLIVAGSMPLSALFCFLLFDACGLTLNVMSLFGLALGLGMLVDNATVVYEHIGNQRMPPPGPAARETALRATEEMVVPLIGGVVTNAIVFVPFLFLSREIQLMYTDVAAAVGASLFASLGISLTTVPLLASGMAVKGAPAWPSWARPFIEKIGALGRAAPSILDRAFRTGHRDSLFGPIAAACGKRVFRRASHIGKVGGRSIAQWIERAGRLPSLRDLSPTAALGILAVLFIGLWAVTGPTAPRWIFVTAAVASTAGGFWGFRRLGVNGPIVFKHRRDILIGAALLALAATALVFRGTERDFQSAGELDEFVIFLEMSSGVRLDLSNAAAAQIERILSEDPEVVPLIKTAVSRVEGWSTKIYVTLVPRAQRALSAEKAIGLLRSKLADIGRDQDPNAFVHFSSPRTGQEIAVQVQGPDYAVLETLAQKVAAGLESIQGLSDVKMRYRPGRPEVRVDLDFDRSAREGLSAEAVAESAHALLRGLRATTFRQGGRQTDVVVRLRRDDREELGALADVPLASPRGRPVRLTEVARLRMDKMPNEIFRENKNRLIQITANRQGLSLGRAAEEIQRVIGEISFPLEYAAAMDREVGEMTRSLHQLTLGLFVMVFLIYVVLVVLFESLIEPVIILSAVPLCLVGVAEGLALFKLPLSTGVLVGVIMLAGVVVNNTIMLLDHLNHHTDRTQPLSERLQQSVRERMRPIFLTAGSAVLGFLPMMMDTSENGVIWRPLAVTLVFGLIFSTMLTLYVMPALTHWLMVDLPEWIKSRNWSSREGDASAPS